MLLQSLRLNAAAAGQFLRFHKEKYLGKGVDPTANSCSELERGRAQPTPITASPIQASLCCLSAVLKFGDPSGSVSSSEPNLNVVF